jgi:hypothetical protein|tara:strand:- start:300 stop:668 length:369 start_codon:yes stop_codon:yes gene_type:complete
MRDRPNGNELAILVKRVEAGDLNIEVPKDKKYRSLMLVSAIEISKRQRETGDDPEREEHYRLSVIMKKKDTLINLNKNLSDAIRKGNFDFETISRDKVRNHLWLTAIDRVYESRPKVLKELS